MGTSTYTFPTFKKFWSFGDTSGKELRYWQASGSNTSWGLDLFERSHHKGWVSFTGSFWSMNKCDPCQLFSQQGHKDSCCRGGMKDYNFNWGLVKTTHIFITVPKHRETNASRTSTASKARVWRLQRKTDYHRMYFCSRGYCFLKTRNFALGNLYRSWVVLKLDPLPPLHL